MIGLYTSPLFTSILPAKIGYIIQHKRKQLGLTQKELAGKTRFSKYMISKIERGMHDIKITSVPPSGRNIFTITFSSFKWIRGWGLIIHAQISK